MFELFVTEGSHRVETHALKSLPVSMWAQDSFHKHEQRNLPLMQAASWNDCAAENVGLENIAIALWPLSHNTMAVRMICSRILTFK